MIPILFTKLNSQTNPIPPQSYPTPIPTMHHDPYVDNSLLGYKTNMNVNHYTLLEIKVVTTPDFMSKSVFLSQYRICEDIGETLCKTI